MEPNRYTTAESWRIIWDIHFKELYLQNSIFKTYIYKISLFCSLELKTFQFIYSYCRFFCTFEAAKHILNEQDPHRQFREPKDG